MVLCVLSTVLFFAGMALYMRSRSSTADFERFSRWRDSQSETLQMRSLGWGVGWGNGTFGMFYSHGRSAAPVEEAATWLYREFGPTRELISPPSEFDLLNWRAGRFQVLHQLQSRPDGSLSLWLVVVPMWTFGLFAIPPLMEIRHILRRRRKAVAPEAARSSRPSQ